MTSVADIETSMAAARANADALENDERASLLGRLRKAGLSLVEAHYNGYGDSGGVEDVTDGMDGDLEKAVSEFVWDFAYSRHPGFENNEGGQGVFTWDIEADSIILDHGDNYIETQHTFEEGL